jgi:hypothetical protein
MPCDRQPLRLGLGPFPDPTPYMVVGSVGPVEVGYDPSLGEGGVAAAQGLLDQADLAYEAVQGWYGSTAIGAPVTAIVVPMSPGHDGSGGALHYGCDFVTGPELFLDAAFNHRRIELGLFIAELTECFQGAQGFGWQCGGSNGEALSRWHAQQLTGGPLGAMRPWETGPRWAAAGHPNWIDRTNNNDLFEPAVGCGMVYLWWMLRRRGFTIAEITQAGGTTLGSNYQLLTGASNGWKRFIHAVRALPHGVTSDNPWS